MAHRLPTITNNNAGCGGRAQIIIPRDPHAQDGHPADRQRPAVEDTIMGRHLVPTSVLFAHFVPVRFLRSSCAAFCSGERGGQARKTPPHRARWAAHCAITRPFLPRLLIGRLNFPTNATHPTGHSGRRAVPTVPSSASRSDRLLVDRTPTRVVVSRSIHRRSAQQYPHNPTHRQQPTKLGPDACAAHAMLKRRDSGAAPGPGAAAHATHARRSVSFLDRQSSVAPLSPSMSTTAVPTAVPPPMLGQASAAGGGGSRFFGVSARGAKLTRPLSTTADLGVVFTVRCGWFVCVMSMIGGGGMTAHAFPSCPQRLVSYLLPNHAPHVRPHRASLTRSPRGWWACKLRPASAASWC